MKDERLRRKSGDKTHVFCPRFFYALLLSLTSLTYANVTLLYLTLHSQRLHLFHALRLLLEQIRVAAQ